MTENKMGKMLCRLRNADCGFRNPKSQIRNRIAKAIALGIAFVLVGAVIAPSWGSEGYEYSGYKWQDEDIPVPYYVYIGLAPPTGISMSDYVNAVRGALQKWEDVPSSYMSFRYRGETAAYRPNLDIPDGRNIAGWTNENLGTALGVTAYWTSGSDLLEADIALDRSKSWSVATPTPFTAFDVHTVLLHEVGHTLSLDHVSALHSEQVMYGYLSNGEMKRELGEGDMAGITFIYPKKGDLTVLEVHGPSSAMEHERVELSATVKNTGMWVTGTCRLEFYLSFDSRIDSKDRLLGEDVIPLLNGDKTYQAKVLVSLPGVIAERSYYICAVADAEEEVQEASEENNTNCYFPLRVWLDSDADGLPNWWEDEMLLDAQDATGQNGSEGDPDGEGLTNSEEYHNGANPLLADTDGDGQNDRQEVLAGTDPTDKESFFAIGTILIDGVGSDRWVTMSWQTIAGKKYQVYYQDRMGSEWIPLGQPRNGTGGTLGQTDPEGLSLPARFYRVRVE